MALPFGRRRGARVLLLSSPRSPRLGAQRQSYWFEWRAPDSVSSIFHRFLGGFDFTRRGAAGGHDAARANRSGAGRRVERLNGNHSVHRNIRRPTQDFLAARSMTKKRLSLILIMESSRFVIEKKKTLLSLSTQRPRSRERRPRRATAARADTSAPAQVSKARTLSTPYPRGPNE